MQVKALKPALKTKGQITVKLNPHTDCWICQRKLLEDKKKHPLIGLYLCQIPNIIQQVKTDTVLQASSMALFLKSCATERTQADIKLQLLGQSIHVRMQSTLYNKYCQSQNYYCTRDINQILGHGSYKAYIIFKDFQTYDEDEEYFKRIYIKQEQQKKSQLLTQYYKFHRDVPRMFIEPQAAIINKYLDKRRKLDYYRIVRIIEEENKLHPGRPPKGIVGEKPSPLNSIENSSQQSRPLQTVQPIKDTKILKDLSFLNESELRKEFSETEKLRKKIDHSVTLYDICTGLGKMKTNTKIFEADLDAFQNTHRQDENNKLTQFIKFQRDLEQQTSHLVRGAQPNPQTKKYIHRPFESLKFTTEVGREFLVTENNVSPSVLFRHQKSETTSPTMQKNVFQKTNQGKHNESSNRGGQVSYQGSTASIPVSSKFTTHIQKSQLFDVQQYQQQQCLTDRVLQKPPPQQVSSNQIIKTEMKGSVFRKPSAGAVRKYSDSKKLSLGQMEFQNLSKNFNQQVYPLTQRGDSGKKILAAQVHKANLVQNKNNSQVPFKFVTSQSPQAMISRYQQGFNESQLMRQAIEIIPNKQSQNNFHVYSKEQFIQHIQPYLETAVTSMRSSFGVPDTKPTKQVPQQIPLTSRQIQPQFTTSKIVRQSKPTGNSTNNSKKQINRINKF